MRSLTVTAAALAMCALGLPSAQALPLSQDHAASRSGVVLVAQKTPEDDSGAKSKSKRASKQRGSSKTATQDTKQGTEHDAALQGSRAPGTSIQMSPRGGYLYGPSFNGAYTPPGGYSMNGYPVRYADEPSGAQAECAPLRRRAMSSGQRSAWDRYYACTQED